MANTIRNVGVNINVASKGENLAKLGEKFQSIATNVDAVTSAVGNLNTAIQAIKTPPNLSKLLTQLQKLKALGNMPNIKKIAEGLKQLSVLKSFPQLDTLVKDLKKLQKLKPPSLTAFTNSLKKLNEIDVGTSADKLRLLGVALQSLKKGKIPTFTAFINSIKELGALRITAVINTIKRLEAAIKKLSEQGKLNSFKKFAADLRSVNAVLTKTSVASSGANQAVSSFRQSIEKGSNSLSKFGSSIKTYLQYSVISSAVMGLRSSFNAAIGSIVDYSQALADLQAITMSTDVEVEQMSDAIKQTASATKFTATEVAEGMKILGQAGLSAAEASATIGSVANLATGTLSSMATSVDLVTTAMRVFNIDASDSARIVDTFANAVNNSKLSIDKISTAFNYVGPLAKEAGLSFEEVNAALGSLANSGLKASTMGTGLRRILAELADPTEKFKKAAKEAGVSLKVLNPATNDLSTVLKNLKFVVKDTDAAFDLFGKRGAAAALALTSTTSGYDKMLDKVSKSGTAAQMAAIQMDGLGIAFKKVVGKAQLLMIAIGEAGLTYVLGKLATALQNVLDFLTSVAEHGFGKFILQVGGAVTILGSLLALFGLLKGAVLSSMAIVKLFSIDMAALTVASHTASGGIAKLVLTIKSMKVALGVIGVLSIAIVGLYTAYKKITGSAAASAKENKKLADSYATQEEAIATYTNKIRGVDKDSELYKDTNIALKRSLYETAAQFPEVAGAALAAANSISSLNGEFIKGTEALDNYNKQLATIKLEKLKASMAASAKVVQDSVDKINYAMSDSSSGFSISMGVQKEYIASLKDYRNEMSKIQALPAPSKKQAQRLEEYGNMVKAADVLLVEFQKSGKEGYSLYLDTEEFVKFIDIELPNASKMQKELLVEAQADLRKTQQKNEYAVIRSAEKQRDALIGVYATIGGSKKEVDALTEGLESADRDIIAKVTMDTDEYDALTKDFEKRFFIKGDGKTLSKELVFDITVDMKGAVQKLRKAQEDLDKLRESPASTAQDYLNANKNIILAEKELQDAKKRITSEGNSIVLELMERNAAKIDMANKKAAIDQTLSAEERANKIIEIEKDYAKEITRITEQTTKDNAAANKAAFDKATAKQQEVTIAREVQSLKALTDARKADYEVIAKYPRIGKLNLAVHKANTKAKIGEKVTLEDTVRLNTEYITATEALAKSSKKSASSFEKYDKAVKENKDAKKKLLKIDDALVKLSRLKITLLEKEKKAIETLGDAQEAYNEAIQAQEVQARTSSAEFNKLTTLKQIAELRAVGITQYDEELGKQVSIITEQEHALRLRKEEYALKLAEGQIETGSVEDISIKTAIAEDEAALIESKQQFVEITTEKNEFIIDSAKKTAQEELAISDAQYAQGKQDEAAYLISINEAQEAGVLTYSEVLDRKLQLLKEHLLAGKVTREEYDKGVTEAAEGGVEATALTEEEESQVMSQESTALENIAYGWEKSTEKAKDFNVVLQETGSLIANNLASGFTNAFTSFVDGTKSAKDAFKDFAKSFLTQIAQMIMQQALLNGLKAIGIGAASGGQVGGTTESGTQKFDTGGKVKGSSPTPWADNIAAWLTAGEFVQPVAAVKKYGSAFMESIRTLRFDPSKFALGGLINGLDMIPRLGYADGGSVATDSTQEVNITTETPSVNIINNLDSGLMGDYLESPKGGKTYINWIGRNRTAIKSLLG